MQRLNHPASVACFRSLDIPCLYLPCQHTCTQDLAHLLASQRRLTHLTLHEVHELEELDTLDPASLWDVLVAAVPVLARRLQVLRVAGCFWNQPELFGGLRQLTAVTELRCASARIFVMDLFSFKSVAMAPTGPSPKQPFWQSLQALRWLVNCSPGGWLVACVVLGVADGDELRCGRLQRPQGYL